MNPIEIIAQAISIVAMLFNIISYQQKKQSRLVLCQLFGGLLFSINFFMLGAITGGILNLIAAVRAVIFLFPKKLHSSHYLWLVGFIASYLVFYGLTFTVFRTKPTPVTFIVEALPVIGMTASSIGFMLAESKLVRRMGLISSPVWLTYNIYYLSIGAIICEVISLVSIFIGIYRHDISKRKD